MTIERYNAKRDFKVTPEPSGDSTSFSQERKLHFVVQHHLSRREHYDLRLEWRGVLLSWAVPKGPSLDPNDKRLAVHVEDHPLEYRHFQGTIPQGQYGAGSVTIWDKGFWTPIGDVDDGLKNGNLKFTLNGEKLNDEWALVRIKDEKNWLLIKKSSDKIVFQNPDITKQQIVNYYVSVADFVPDKLGRPCTRCARSSQHQEF